jgi:hypothetical protein
MQVYTSMNWRLLVGRYGERVFIHLTDRRYGTVRPIDPRDPVWHHRDVSGL